MPDRKHMADEIELHIERRIPVWNCSGGQSPWTHIQRHLPPVIYQRHVRHADLADDLGPHMQGVAGGRPFVHHQRWPAVASRGVVHVIAPPAPHSLTGQLEPARSRRPLSLSIRTNSLPSRECREQPRRCNVPTSRNPSILGRTTSTPGSGGV